LIFFTIFFVLFDVLYMIGLCNDFILPLFSVGNFNCFVVPGWTLKVKMSFTFEENLVLYVLYTFIVLLF